MKKTILLVFFLANLLTQAQNKIILSVSSGLTFSNIRGNDFAEENKYDFNYVGGIGIEKPINNKISIFTGLNYDNKSFKNEIYYDYFNNYDPFIYPNKVKVQLTLQYLTMPILFRYYFDNESHFYINSGPYLGVFLNTTARVDGDKVNEDSNEIFKKVDFGWSLGIGKKFKINEKNKLSVELRDNLGLQNISDVPVQGNGTVKTNSFNLILGYEFNL
ncbi:porin family protein [Flavobacterium sp. NRK F7]|uniref:porin family protein n=1 Tax=Flavobacterium sp. NRK F7 TaxID=2954930 RepID=UPI0020915319|nr:porin family protein [Flavobacterium sp. NRK F7]MCO6161942.1 PorT family protein [Flavobacterium sp. NRK F7]